MQNESRHRKNKSSGLPDWKTVLVLVAVAVCSMLGIGPDEEITPTETTGATQAAVIATVTTEAIESEETDSASLPTYTGSPYVELNGNVPEFEDVDYDTEPFEEYGELDPLGRCTQAFACVSPELMPTRERGNISHIKPTGWHRTEYDFIDGGLLYNRCHLIAHQLTAEDDNRQNLITGTRYMNDDAMNTFEIMIGDYVRQTGNRVLYRVTPFFEGDELIARGVQLEAWSIEDEGEGICLNVYCFNVQPGIGIDYATGESWIEETECGHPDAEYVLNTNSMKYHTPDCEGIANTNPDNLASFTGCYETLDIRGYTPCGSCHPAG